MMIANQETLARLLTEVRDACLFDDDDGRIGVTEEPHLSDDLFNRICEALDPRPAGYRCPQTQDMFGEWHS